MSSVATADNDFPQILSHSIPMDTQKVGPPVTRPDLEFAMPVIDFVDNMEGLSEIDNRVIRNIMEVSRTLPNPEEASFTTDTSEQKAAGHGRYELTALRDVDEELPIWKVWATAHHVRLKALECVVEEKPGASWGEDVVRPILQRALHWSRRGDCVRISNT